MVFSSQLFVFLFLPLVLVLNYCIPRKCITAKNIALLAASLVFYAWGEPRNIFLMLGSIAANYFFGRWIGQLLDRQAMRRAALIVSLVFNLGLLIFFKYFNFITGGRTDIALPIGISFFTFQITSYVMDVYRNHVEPQKSLLKLALYISLFPQLIAGPIVRYVDIEKQLSDRMCTMEKTARGVQRFIVGFSKKVLLSNTLAQVADITFGIEGKLPGALAWLGVVCYALQIYYDFSGYSDMAIGLGHMLGFDFLENFNFPYVSKSVKEFWRRWHISLSTWFRDYLYIPLGGNRKGRARTYLNLLIVFAATGFWHGASWSFLLWGLFHGFFLVLERGTWGRWVAKLPRAISWLYTMLAVLTGWVLFRADTLYKAIVYLDSMFNFADFGLKVALAQVDNVTAIMLLMGIVFSAPVVPWLSKKYGAVAKPKIAVEVVRTFISILIFAVSLLFLSGSVYNPFIYFRF